MWYGIAALLDKTNEITEQSPAQRLFTQLTPLFEERGVPTKGGKAHAKMIRCKEWLFTLHSVFTRNKALFNLGQEFISKHVLRNIMGDTKSISNTNYDYCYD